MGKITEMLHGKGMSDKMDLFSQKVDDIEMSNIDVFKDHAPTCKNGDHDNLSCYVNVEVQNGNVRVWCSESDYIPKNLFDQVMTVADQIFGT